MKHPISQEELYQQFLDELQPGAEEYDRMMQAGKNPAAQRRPRRLLPRITAAHITPARVVAAACLLVAATALTWIGWQTDHPNQQQPMAQASQPMTQASQQPTPKATKQPPPSPKQKPTTTSASTETPPAPTAPRTALPASPSPQPQAQTATAHLPITEQAPSLPDPKEVERQKAILEKDLERALLERQIGREIVARSIQKVEQPQTILCAI